nr:hypothetical protein BJF81_00730 [Ipomoea batatas]
MAPETPKAIYNSGATIFPVCPTWRSLGTYPASTAARVAPTTTESFSASFSIILKFSVLFKARPPVTTTRAFPKSGRSVF